MTIKILLAVGIGIFLGHSLLPPGTNESIGPMIDFGLCLLLFFVGIDIGRQKDIFIKVKKMGFRVLLIPLMIAVGSISGAMVGGFMLRLPLNQAGAVGAGFGWYSLSAIELSKHSPQLGSLAFITNVTREVIALLSIPLIAKHLGSLECIAPAGATAMDTTLPIISKATDGSVAVISFITGVVLSTLVPILVPLLMSIG